jgi:uncharacterized membrane protein
MSSNSSRSWMSRTQRYVFAGVLTVIPIWITWFIFTFVFQQLSKVGLPLVQSLAATAEAFSPELSAILLNAFFQSLVAVLLTVAAFYFLGWAATKMIGRRLIHLFDALMQRIPLVQTIYGGTKKLLAALQQKPDQVQRVVLIDFPSPHMKTVGFVTRVLTDEDTGQQLAAVYVPTTPNPTSGYLEIVPVERLISTDWTMDQAMTFIISGGAVAPERIHYSKSAERKSAASAG